MKMVLGIFFITLANVNTWFVKKELFWRSHMTTEALPTTKLIDKNEFAAIALCKNRLTS